MTKPFPEVIGWLRDDEFLSLQRLATGKRVLEIGCYQGRSTVAMATTAEHVFTIDSFAGDDFTEAEGGISKDVCRDAFLRNTKQFENVSLLEFDMYDMLKNLLPSNFDFIFYDAGHSADDTKFFLDWVQSAPDDTIIALHDYKPDGEPKWHESAVVMMDFHRRTGRKFIVIGSLLILYNGTLDFEEKDFTP